MEFEYITRKADTNAFLYDGNHLNPDIWKVSAYAQAGEWKWNTLEHYGSTSIEIEISEPIKIYCDGEAVN